MQIFAASDRGVVREENQDSFAFFCVEGTDFLIVCDGLGGHLGGSRASSLACDVIEQKITEQYKKDFSQGKLEEILRDSINEANVVIWRHSVKEVENRGMGTTIVIAAVRNGAVTVMNLGDSRAYMISDGDIVQITKDQSYVQSLVDKGEITPEEAKNYPGKSIIMQAAGLGDNVHPDVYKIQMEKTLLLCSDGLTGELEDSEILRIIKECGIENAAGELIEKAKSAGGRDNITVLLGAETEGTML